MKNLQLSELKKLEVEEMRSIKGGSMVDDFIQYCINGYNALKRIVESY